MTIITNSERRCSRSKQSVHKLFRSALKQLIEELFSSFADFKRLWAAPGQHVADGYRFAVENQPTLIVPKIASILSDP